MDGGQWGKKPQALRGATICAAPGPPFPAHRIIQARFLLLLSEKPCVSTGVAGVPALGDCACAPAHFLEEKCRLGENPSQAALASLGCRRGLVGEDVREGPGAWHRGVHAAAGPAGRGGGSSGLGRGDPIK